MENLILTGYGWTDYAVAAAVALKGLGGLADVAGVSKRRLPELLETLAKGVRKIFILGVALGGDEPRLAAALKALRRHGVAVTWISAVAASESQVQDVLLDFSGVFLAVPLSAFIAVAYRFVAREYCAKPAEAAPAALPAPGPAGEEG